VFLVDTSALARARMPTVQARLSALNEVGELATCLPLMLESGYSARSLREHDEIFESLFPAWRVLDPVPELSEVAVSLQRRLFEAGMGRAVGAFDLMVAAHALHYSDQSTQVTVVHYDEDYDHLVSVAPELSASWIVPRWGVP
jgi:predicted nucleic acid-binding protein